MKYRFAALLTAAAVPIAWQTVHAQTTAVAIPFAEALTIQAYSAAAGTLTTLARLAGGGYISLEFDFNPPYTIGPPGALAQWLSGGSKNLLDFPAGPVGVGRQSQVSALADIDNKGLAGFAFADGDKVLVFHGALYELYPIGPDVNTVFFADFNADGYPDLAVAYDGSNTVPGGIAILINNGDGTFANPVLYGTGLPATQFFPAGGLPATRFAVFDLNHDNILDIATVSLDQTVTVLLGEANGKFGTPVRYAVGAASAEAVTIADFDGDKIPDIVAGGTTGILLGNGDGTFRAGPPLPAVASSNFIWAFAAGDLNGDGKMDLVCANTQDQFVAPFFGNGDGTFQQGQAYSVSTLPDSLVLADYNNDGLLDIINGTGDARGFGAGDESGFIDILLNNGNKTFQGAANYLPPLSQYGFVQALGASAAVANFGGGFPGVLASSANGTVTLFPGDGKGGFQTSQTFTIPPAMAGSSGYAGAIATADFNGDGLPDAAVITSNGVAILLANAGGFGTPSVIAGPFPSAIATGDFDGDKKADLVVMTSGSGDASSPGTLTFLKGNGNGTFGAPVTIPAGFTPVYVASADLNGDGRLDLVFADNGYEVSGTTGVGGAIYVALNAGGGVFQTPVPVFSGIYPTFAIVDINGDSKLDLVASQQAVVSWLPGNGNGTFQAPVAITTSDAPVSSIVVQDFNGDDNQDIVLAHQDSETSFLAGQGNGAFSAETSFAGPYEPVLLLTTDLNGDGKPDLIDIGFTMVVLLNNSAPPTTIQTSPGGLQFSVDQGAVQTAPQTLSLSQGSHTITVLSPQAGTAGIQYVFSKWSDGGAASHSITVGASAVTYTATFTTQYQLTVSASPAAGGTVTPVTGGFYDSGTAVPVTAVANSGYTFTGWTGSVASSSSSSTTVTMSGPQTATANFSGGSGHPAFFNGEASLGGGVYYLQFPDNSLFGYYNYASSSILYHYDMGFEAFIPSTSGQIYFYDFTSGHWWYTSSGLFPYLYDFTLNTFIYYFPNTTSPGHYTTNPRSFVNLTTGVIFTM